MQLVELQSVPWELIVKSDGARVSIAIELTVEHANEPPSFQANSVDVCRPSCIRGEGDPKVLTMCKLVSLPHRGEGGRVGVGFLERLCNLQWKD